MDAGGTPTGQTAMNNPNASFVTAARTGAALMLLLALAGCVVAPAGPTMMALPGTGKTFDQFRADDAACRQYAYQQISGTTQAAEQAAVQSAAVGTAIGAVAGAALGGSRGAAVGAGTGLIMGSATGSSASYAYGYQAQRAFDQAYLQCMYAAGHRVPVYGSFSGSSTYQSAPAGAVVPPPPPAGTPPPPPPGIAPPR